MKLTVEDLSSAKFYYKLNAHSDIDYLDGFDEEIESNNEKTIKFDELKFQHKFDFIILAFVSYETRSVHNLLIALEFIKSKHKEIDSVKLSIASLSDNSIKRDQSHMHRSRFNKETIVSTNRHDQHSLLHSNTNRQHQHQRSISDYSGLNYKKNSHHLAKFISSNPHKTLLVHPGEAIKLTSSELKPKDGLNIKQSDRLVYILVSGEPKFGKLFKILSWL
jgi:hypothetical protein